LLKGKKIGPDYPVECKVCDEDQAIEVSTAENMMREDMHPADQFQAFQDLVNQGRSIEDVASRFGCSPQLVRQRLKIANVAPELVKLFREGQIELEQMMALAITNDHERQCRVWNEVEGWQRRPEQLRRFLTKGEIEGTDAVARFVGVEDYEKAGGVVRKDLFTEGLKGIYFADAGLLERLANEKLASVAGEVEAEGWKWVEARPQVTYSDLNEFERGKPTSRKATDAEDAKEAALRKQLDELREALEAEDLSDDEYEAQDQRADAISAEIEEMRKARLHYSVKVRKTAGAIVSLGHDGSPEIHRGLIRREDRKDAKKAAKETEAANNGSDTKGAKISDSLCHALTAHKTLAMQALMLDRPDVALVATVHNLLATAILDVAWLNSGIEIKASPERVNITGGDTEAFESKAGLLCAERVAKVKAELPEAIEDLWDWLFEQDQKKLLELLAVAVSVTVNAVQLRDNDKALGVSVLEHHLGLNMATWWEPTGKNYLARVSKEQIVDAVKECGLESEAAELAKLKKSEAVARAGQLIEGKGWLPKLLCR
jgi:ParB family transcriptional regulator, chromosome partitioning protein